MVKKAIKKEAFQYSRTTFSLSLAEADALLRKQQNKAILHNQIIKHLLLSRSDIVPRNARWIYDWMTLLCMVAVKLMHCD